MKWVPFAVCSGLMASIAFGEGLVVTFDPPQKVEALTAGEKDGGFFAATVGTVGDKAFSKMTSVQLKKGAPKALRSDECSPFPVLNLSKPVIAQSLVFTWKEGVVTGFLQTKDESFRIDFKKEGDKGDVTKVGAEDVPKGDTFPQFKIPAAESPVFIKAKKSVR